MNIAIAGAGYWGKNYVRILNGISGPWTGVVVVDSSKDTLEGIQTSFPRVNTSHSLEDVLNDDSVKAVIIATPTSTHLQIALQCIEKGKHVLCEKPLTTSSASSEELRRRAEDKNVTLMVGHTFIYNNAFRKLSAIMSEKQKLGPVHYICAKRTNLGPIRQDVSVIWDLAPHDLSMILRIMDEDPVRVSAVASKNLGGAMYDVAFITLTFPNNVLAHIHVSWIEPFKERKLVVVAGKRRVVFDDMNLMEPVKVFEKGVAPDDPKAEARGDLHNAFVLDGDIISPKVDFGEPLLQQVQHFGDCVVTGCRPLTGGEHATCVIRVLEGIDASAAAHGRPYDFTTAALMPA